MVLYVLWVFCVCDCDTCLAVFERLCVLCYCVLFAVKPVCGYECGVSVHDSVCGLRCVMRDALSLCGCLIVCVVCAH